jgi:UDP-N-acetylglucosamine--N-acetylmuramyl-(pentapeptide) pyrophosphoryl-undecaprenol N-acetylglucosamine transferase
VIAAGGTAGHVVPALSVADELRAEGADVTFIGGERAELELVPAAGYELHRIRVAGLDRRNPVRAARALALAAAGTGRAIRLLRELRPDAVLGAGGYAAGPVGVAAVLRRVPLVLAEADSHLGLTNRTLAPFAARVCLAFALPGRTGRRYLVTGRPVPSPATDRAAARERFGIGADETAVLVFGGSLGARLLNDLALDAWAESGPAVIHLCGERDYAELQGRVSRPDYILQPFMDEIGVAYGAADVVLARAGGSVWELAAAGLPAVLVPGEFATGQHQEKNARWFADAGGAVVVPEAEAERAPQVVDELLGDTDRLTAMAAAMRSIAKPNAAEEIADELVSLAAARR